MGKQSRRSISVRGITYDKLRQYGETHDRSMSDVVEELLATILDKESPAVVAAVPSPSAPSVIGKTLPARERSASRMRFNPPPPNKPRPTLAHRTVRAVAPSPPQRPIPSNKPQLPGRPAPTPASAVVGTKRVESKDDYRGIRF